MRWEANWVNGVTLDNPNFKRWEEQRGYPPTKDIRKNYKDEDDGECVWHMKIGYWRCYMICITCSRGTVTEDLSIPADVVVKQSLAWATKLNDLKRKRKKDNQKVGLLQTFTRGMEIYWKLEKLSSWEAFDTRGKWSKFTDSGGEVGSNKISSTAERRGVPGGLEESLAQHL